MGRRSACTSRKAMDLLARELHIVRIVLQNITNYMISVDLYNLPNPVKSVRQKNGDEGRTEETPYYLTTETPERKSTKVITATRPKPEASTTRLHVGERVVVALTSFSVLPPQKPRS